MEDSEDFQFEQILDDIREILYQTSNTTQELNPMSIAGYVIRRSLTDYKLFNVVAVDKNQDWLYTASSDVDADQAIEDHEQLTKDLEYIQQNYLKGRENE